MSSGYFALAVEKQKNSLESLEELAPFKTCFLWTGVIFNHDYEKKGTGTTKTRGDKLTYMDPRDIFFFFGGVLVMVMFDPDSSMVHPPFWGIFRFGSVGDFFDA